MTPASGSRRAQLRSECTADFKLEELEAPAAEDNLAAEQASRLSTRIRLAVCAFTRKGASRKPFSGASEARGLRERHYREVDVSGAIRAAAAMTLKRDFARQAA